MESFISIDELDLQGKSEHFQYKQLLDL